MNPAIWFVQTKRFDFSRPRRCQWPHEDAMLRALFFIAAIGILALVTVAVFIHRAPPPYSEPEPDYAKSVEIHMDLAARRAVLKYFRTLADVNGFEADYRSSPLGHEFFTLGLLRRDIVVQVLSPFDDPREIEIFVIQKDSDPATQPRVDDLKTYIEKTIVEIPGVRLEPVTGMTTWRRGSDIH